MNRNDFQQLVDIRLKEAKVLLDNQCFDGAYYLLYSKRSSFRIFSQGLTQRIAPTQWFVGATGWLPNNPKT